MGAGGGTDRWRRKGRRKLPICESIGHWPLWGRCPKVISSIQKPDMHDNNRVKYIKPEIENLI